MGKYSKLAKKRAAAKREKMHDDYISDYKYRDKTILIQIPAYKDVDLLNTVYSALQQADFPERIHFIVCYQKH